VLTGSTNWTSTGLCTQTNNALVVESAKVAQRYISYWNTLKADVEAAEGDQRKLQSPAQRTWDHNANESSINSPVDLGSGVTVEPMFSPNTNHLLKNPPKETPNDMERIFELIAGAKQAVLFLAFDPGNNSILDAAGKALAANPDLFVRGALTSPQRAGNFAAALHEGEEAGEGEEGRHGERGATEVAVVGEHGQPRRKGRRSAAKKGARPALEPDYRAIPAGAVNKDDAFGAWEAELNKYGFAIIHNKIVVIDPFSDNCTVVTGSHNLGFRASHNNDDNLVVIRGHRGLAEAYACHVLDIYDHYAWRYWLKEYPKDFGKPLETDDKWQARYILGPNVKSPELRFWLAAAGAGVAGAAAGPRDRAAARPASSKKRASKRAGLRTSARSREASLGARERTAATRKKHR
jgi:phosphatidylserine/phosphatidylglycerophosphate/cardiolipin synthase-like enzyme